MNGSRRRDVRGARRNFKRRWKRWLARLPQGWGAFTMFGLLLLLGIAIWVQAAPNAWVGLAIAAIGAGGIVRATMRWRQAYQERAERQRHREEQKRRQEARRQRAAERHAERQRLADQARAARERGREAEEQRRLQERRELEIQAAARQEREERVAAEAARLATLDNEGLLQASALAFEKRGLMALPVGDEAGCDLELKSADGILQAVARRVPNGRVAEATDVRALNAWREATGASSAYLIAASGFSPSAVRAASALPFTLVETYLLAQWRAD